MNSTDPIYVSGRKRICSNWVFFWYISVTDFFDWIWRIGYEFSGLIVEEEDSVFVIVSSSDIGFGDSHNSCFEEVYFY